MNTQTWLWKILGAQCETVTVRYSRCCTGHFVHEHVDELTFSLLKDPIFCCNVGTINPYDLGIFCWTLGLSTTIHMIWVFSVGTFGLSTTIHMIWIFSFEHWPSSVKQTTDRMQANIDLKIFSWTLWQLTTVCIKKCWSGIFFLNILIIVECRYVPKHWSGYFSFSLQGVMYVRRRKCRMLRVCPVDWSFTL